MIGAMDLQNVFSKTQLVERLYQTMLHHPDQSQRQFALHMLQKHHEDQRRTREAVQKDRVEIHRDRDEGGGRRSNERADEAEDTENNEDDGTRARRTPREGEPGSHINIVA